MEIIIEIMGKMIKKITSRKTNKTAKSQNVDKKEKPILVKSSNNLLNLEDKETKLNNKKVSKIPKKYIKAFAYFQKEKKDSLQFEKPELDNTEIANLIADLWNTKMTEVEKAPYLQLSKNESKSVKSDQSIKPAVKRSKKVKSVKKSKKSNDINESVKDDKSSTEVKESPEEKKE